MMPPDWSAFSTEVRLAVSELKDELRKDINKGCEGVLVEVRERLSRMEDHREIFHKETRNSLMELTDLARTTNGRVNRHDDILDGTPGQPGLQEQVRSNTTWRNGLVAAGAAWLGFLSVIWLVWGDEVKARGILNRPASDYQDFVDARIKQWAPDVPKPIAAPPPLGAKKTD